VDVRRGTQKKSSDLTGSTSNEKVKAEKAGHKRTEGYRLQSCGLGILDSLFWEWR
jgi:hypothetical protein